MFGMGFMEIFLVLIVAIVALGPEKLPGAVVDIAKFFKKFKGSIDDVKSTLDSELHISEMKKEANEFKSSVSSMNHISSLGLDDMSTISNEPKTVEKEIKEPSTTPVETINDSEQFKVNSDQFKINKEKI